MKNVVLARMGSRRLSRKGCFLGPRVHRESHSSRSRVPRLAHRSTSREVQLRGYSFRGIAFVPVEKKNTHIRTGKNPETYVQNMDSGL